MGRPFGRLGVIATIWGSKVSTDSVQAPVYLVVTLRSLQMFAATESPLPILLGGEHA